MSIKKLNILRVDSTLNNLIELGSEKLPFTFEFTKTIKNLKKTKDEFNDLLDTMRESFYVQLPNSKKGASDVKVFKKFLFKKEGSKIIAIRDKSNKMIEIKDESKLEKGQLALPAVPDENMKDFEREYNKLIEHEFEVEIHQILVERFEEALQDRFKVKGEAVDSNIIEELLGTVIVDSFE